MITQFKITKPLVRKLLSVVDAGLTSGLGENTPGAMCVEAAVCYAMGLPHGDEPTCVDSALRRFKIDLNDARWSSTAARAKGLRRLAVAQLGSAGSLDTQAFVTELSKYAVESIVPRAKENAARAADAAASSASSASSAAANAAAARANAARADANAARAAADAAARTATAAANAAARAAAAAAAARTADAAASSASSASSAAAADKELSQTAEDVVQILIRLNAPGCAFLYMTETI
jgi:hypothetical protein